MKEDFDFSSLDTESVDEIVNIGLKNPAYLKLIELILNCAKRKDSLGDKIDQLRKSATKINWTVVDDVTDDFQESHSTFGASSSTRFDSMRTLWTETREFSKKRTIERTIKEMSEEYLGHDLESGSISQKGILEIKLPILSEISVRKYSQS